MQSYKLQASTFFFFGIITNKKKKVNFAEKRSSEIFFCGFCRFSIITFYVRKILKTDPLIVQPISKILPKSTQDTPPFAQNLIVVMDRASYGNNLCFCYLFVPSQVIL